MAENADDGEYGYVMENERPAKMTAKMDGEILLFFFFFGIRANFSTLKAPARYDRHMIDWRRRMIKVCFGMLKRAMTTPGYSGMGHDTNFSAVLQQSTRHNG